MPLQFSALTTSVKKEPLSDWELKNLKNLKNGDFYYCIWQTLLQDMVNNDVAPEGDYVIKVYW